MLLKKCLCVSNKHSKRLRHLFLSFVIHKSQKLSTLLSFITLSITLFVCCY
nr:hypothetical protein [Cnaphalocrocis medinalis granulovirus]